MAVGLVALIYGRTGDFTWLFGTFALLSLCVALTALLLPRVRKVVEGGVSPAPVPSGGGD